MPLLAAEPSLRPPFAAQVAVGIWVVASSWGLYRMVTSGNIGAHPLFATGERAVRLALVAPRGAPALGAGPAPGSRV